MWIDMYDEELEKKKEYYWKKGISVDLFKKIKY